MKRAFFCLTTILALGVTSSLYAADTRATTDELPAALKSLQPKTAKILTSHEAKNIRGQGRPKFHPHHPSVKFPGNKYTGHRTGQDLKPGWGGLK